MAQLNYTIFVTGDCNSLSAGTITLVPLGGTSPYNVNWVSPNLGIDLSVTSSTKTNLSADTYVVEITDSSTPLNNQIYANIAVSSGFCCTVTSVSNTTCGQSNGSVVAESTSYYSLTNIDLYDGLDNYISSATTLLNSINFDGLSAGTYYMVARDIGGCSGRSETFIVEDSSQLSYGLYVVPNSSCGYTPIGKIYVTGQTGTPPYNYLWSNGETEYFVTGLTSGEYSVTVTDFYGCSLTQSGTVTDIQSVNVAAITANPPTCLTNDGSITLFLTGGTSPFYISASTGYIEITFSDYFTLSGIGAGVYSFNITDAALCSTSCATILATPSGMTNVNVITKNSNCSVNDGSITVDVQGGELPITYSLTYPDSSVETTTTALQFAQFQKLSGGTYILSVQDASGCTFNNNYTLTTNSTFTISLETTGTTYGQNNGIIKVTATTGGTLPYTYTLDNKTSFLNTPLTEVTFTNVTDGQHTIKVTDFTGCTQEVNVVVNKVEPTQFFLYPKNILSNNDGEINVFISSGIPPFTFNWSENVSGNPQTTHVAGLSAGTYTLTVTDSIGSSLQRDAEIFGSTNISSFQTFTMGEQTFTPEYNAKYSISKMYNEGFQDLISGNTNCDLISADFTAKVYVAPYGTTLTETFFTSTSLLNSPTDNLWYDTIKPMVMSITGVGDVIIDETNNEITIVNDTKIVPSIDIKIYMIIDYNINCQS